ncbi:uncharacterized protein LOC143911789 isoform X2 [Arctopsyche grandis]|uniref:uncharacterized protein LOC143911789 isoform X2 n=1 Tax=Arctopsyche grandis TaxID=121162 RepID=UPI00406D8947
MEKEHQPDSMATVTMKPEYPPSEVYSTSEPPPAYRHPKPASVQIAKIVAGTIIISSLLLGSFILAASYVQARAGCHQLDQLDAMLEKELALEARQMQADALIQDEPLPSHSAQALHQQPPSEDQRRDALNKQESKINEEKLQSLDDDSQSDGGSESGESETSESESGEGSSDSGDSSDENDVAREPIRITLPLQLDFDELAGALMEKNQRSRMNCIVEKRRAEELVDHQPRNLRLPFGLNLTTDPRLERVTGERMAIFCESGNDQKHIPDAAEIMPGLPVPLPGPVRLPLNFPVHPAMRFAMRPPMPAQHMQAPAPQQPPQFEMPQQFHAPQQYQQAQQSRAFPPHLARFTFIPQRPEFPQQQVQQQQQQQQMTLIPREVRIHVQRVQMPHVEHEQVPEDTHVSQEEQRQSDMMQLQELPGGMQMITAEELRAVQQAVRVAEEHAEQQRAQRAQQQAQEAHEASHEMLGRQAMARALPVHIPVPMMQPEEPPVQDPERPHYVQPRSVRSVDALLHREKRVKRSCSCDCAC